LALIEALLIWVRVRLVGTFSMLVAGWAVAVTVEAADAR
jgi:hypothetical protein